MAVSEFQLALIGTGAVAVVAVWGYNNWQEYRQRKAAEKIFRGGQRDVLAGESPEVEEAAPTHEYKPVTHFAESHEPRIEPVFSPRRDNDEGIDIAVADDLVGEAAVLHSPVATETPDEAMLDSVIEVGIALPATQDVIPLQQSWQAINKVDFSKRIRWIARAAGAVEWCEVDASTAAQASHAYVAIQLADRQGVISQDELRVFCHTAEAVATAQGGQGAGIDLSSLDEIMAHARAVDELCASVDIQIAIHIVGRSGQAFAGTKLRGMLEAAGLQLAADGLFYLLDVDGKRLLSVCNSGAVPFDLEQMRTGTTSDVTFWLDVPRVDGGGRVFDIMVATARQLAEALDGILVDDQRNPLADSVLAGIRAKVIELQTQMKAHGIPAGGRRALRLFA